MIQILFITVLYGVWLFFAYAILLPNYRYTKRIQIFKLRDELRNLKYEKQITTRAFDILEDAIKNGINTLPFLNVYDVHKISNEIENTSLLKEEIRLKMEEIEKQSEEVKKIQEDVTILIAKTSVMNMIGWLPIFIPLITLFTLFKSSLAPIFNGARKIALNSSGKENYALSNLSFY